MGERLTRSPILGTETGAGPYGLMAGDEGVPFTTADASADTVVTASTLNAYVVFSDNPVTVADVAVLFDTFKASYA